MKRRYEEYKFHLPPGREPFNYEDFLASHFGKKLEFKNKNPYKLRKVETPMEKLLKQKGPAKQLPKASKFVNAKGFPKKLPNVQDVMKGKM